MGLYAPGPGSLSAPNLAKSRLTLPPPNEQRGKEGFVERTCLPEAAGRLYVPVYEWEGR